MSSEPFAYPPTERSSLSTDFSDLVFCFIKTTTYDQVSKANYEQALQ